MTRITSESITSYSRPSHRIRQNKSRKYSTAPVVKSELKEEQLDDITFSILASLSRELGWKELDYLDASSWSKDEIIKHLITNSFSVPGRTHRSKWATITSADGSTTVVPNLYRIPLMFVGQFMWSSLRLVLGDEKEWAEFKTGILHVSRLCEAFLGEVRRAMSEGIGRSWRCAMFDTALVRYRMGWLLSEPKHFKEFWEMYGEEEYRKDVVKFDWKKLVLRGIKGFKLDEEQVEGGVTAIQWMSGLKELSGDWFWDTSDNPLCGKNASEYLEYWQRTKTWEMSPSPILPTHNEAVPVKPQLQSGACCTANAATIDINWDSLTLTISSPSPELFRLLYRKLQLQDERIAVLEKEVSMLSALQAVKTPVVVPDSAPIFVPTQNFPEMSDPDCAAGFWSDPLEKFLDMDMDEVTADVKNESDIERVEISSIPGHKDDMTSAPIKSLRKLQRMEG